MTLNEALTRVAPTLTGRVATNDEIALLRESLPARLLWDWLLRTIHTHRLIGSRMSLSEKADRSGVGTELLWLTPEHMISEINDAEPGLTVCSQGFLPIGACATGSGDPYFLDLGQAEVLDPPVVRVLHDFAGRGEYPAEGLELVAPTLSSFLLQAAIR